MNFSEYRLEDRIRTLCQKLIESDDAEFESVAMELRSALKEHIGLIRGRLRVFSILSERRTD